MDEGDILWGDWAILPVSHCGRAPPLPASRRLMLGETLMSRSAATSATRTQAGQQPALPEGSVLTFDLSLKEQ